MDNKTRFSRKKNSKIPGAVILFSGIVFLVIFFPLGIINIIVGIAMLSMGKEIYSGTCPFCNGVVNMDSSEGAATCPKCKKRVIARNDFFECVE
jgi:hypothetical protein